MKRSAALVPLSREHHTALVLAKRIASHCDDAAALAELMRQIQTRHAADLLAHFDEEERVLPPVLQGGDPEPVLRLLDEHARLRTLLQRIDADDRQALNEFATLLAAHVRFEERELFPRFEARLSLS
ncbi:hemerythrin domain-containing protein [Paludibacterium purpuratum]|uniref:Hemerythrin HHE cation binding domain-containing protein n=1 Tax=Paludibacterium purpuratum TaxID=1144873 RepID=A0A4R7AUL7_9NEIS|nr:hemerythrin domain-containing protein [Paludibacterium purpuratum]TDR70619.1 hemerythrin HHE cation binding domain-containing protein [Paludibacterium purpuratum]